MAYLSSIEASDCSVVRKLAEQAFGRSVHDVLPLGGLIAHNFMVDNQRVFKVASSRSCVDDWQRLVANAPVLQQHLSVQIPIPTLHILKHGSEQIPAISYERLPGFCMSRAMFAEKDDAFKKNYFSQLSEKIHELHQVSPDVLPARPLTVLQQAVNMLFNNKTARKYVPKIAKCLFPYSSDHPVLLHTDLHAENICFDGKKITGLLDFDSLSIGHPVFEFRPKLYKKEEDLHMILNDYIQRYPSEVSRPVAEDFLRKFDTVFFLFFVMSLIRVNKKNKTRFEDALKVYRAGYARGTIN
ncbi:MAG: aminoglycoside phosphotransferase family protein [Alphaproteobacteria bacterium]|nr:aminoglycoside phosphotransferase family protein [Alphaproteobacteria bacterium]